MTKPIGELNPPPRLMMTPGPCSIDPRVYRALATPLVGHLDPWFKGCMEETQVIIARRFSDREPHYVSAVGFRFRRHRSIGAEFAGGGRRSNLLRERIVFSSECM